MTETCLLCRLRQVQVFEASLSVVRLEGSGKSWAKPRAPRTPAPSVCFTARLLDSGDGEDQRSFAGSNPATALSGGEKWFWKGSLNVSLRPR